MNIIVVKDNEDYSYIYGFLILKSNIFDTTLFQNRLNEMREKLGYDYNGDEIVKAVLEKYGNDYKNIKYVLNVDNELFV